LMLPGGSFFVRYLFNSVERKDPFADNIKPTSAYLGRYWWQILFSPHIIRNLGHFLDILRKIRKFDETELGILRKKHKAAMRVEADRFGIDIKTLEAASRLWIPSFLYNESKVANIWRFMTYEPESTYRNRAARIQNLLNVKYVVFGHTHEADLFLFSHESGEYANSGTWTKIFSKNPAEQLLREEQESVYVQILRQEGKLELMRWRDELGIGERVNLFE
jgi:UDP-2,3-diacylglucosamine pyrophosphatase LpxH